MCDGIVREWACKDILPRVIYDQRGKGTESARSGRKRIELKAIQCRPNERLLRNQVLALTVIDRGTLGVLVMAIRVLVLRGKGRNRTTMRECLCN